MKCSYTKGACALRHSRFVFLPHHTEMVHLISLGWAEIVMLSLNTKNTQELEMLAGSAGTLRLNHPIIYLAPTEVPALNERRHLVLGKRMEKEAFKRGKTQRKFIFKRLLPGFMERTLQKKRTACIQMLNPRHFAAFLWEQKTSSWKPNWKNGTWKLPHSPSISKYLWGKHLNEKSLGKFTIT